MALAAPSRGQTTRPPAVRRARRSPPSGRRRPHAWAQLDMHAFTGALGLLLHALRRAKSEGGKRPVRPTRRVGGERATRPAPHRSPGQSTPPEQTAWTRHRIRKEAKPTKAHARRSRPPLLSPASPARTCTSRGARRGGRLCARGCGGRARPLRSLSASLVGRTRAQAPHRATRHTRAGAWRRVRTPPPQALGRTALMPPRKLSAPSKPFASGSIAVVCRRVHGCEGVKTKRRVLLNTRRLQRLGAAPPPPMQRLPRRTSREGRSLLREPVAHTSSALPSPPHMSHGRGCSSLFPRPLAPQNEAASPATTTTTTTSTSVWQFKLPSPLATGTAARHEAVLIRRLRRHGHGPVAAAVCFRLDGQASQPADARFHHLSTCC